MTRLTGVDSGEFSRVSDDACEACCSSFPPSPVRLNPVVASLVYTAASRIFARGGTIGCTMEQAARVKTSAEREIDIVFPERFNITPARAVSSCVWLGEASGPLAAGQSYVQDAEQIYRCRHPAHDITTLSGCRGCRDWTKHRPISRMLKLKELVPLPRRRCGPHVERWGIGVTTAARRRPTLEMCLDAILRAGWEEPRLFIDGHDTLPARYSHLPTTWREDPIGAWPAWYLLLSELIAQNPDADAYVVLQDDAAVFDRESLRGYLEDALWPGDRPGIVSLFYTGRELDPGWHTAREAWHWGAQAFVLPPKVARAIVSDAQLSEACRSASKDNHVPIPQLLADWCRRSRTEVWYPNPSLVQHIGNTSTIWMDAAITAGRRAFWFCGNIDTAFGAEESFCSFPEDLFPYTDNARGEYVCHVDCGRRRMKQRSVVICGLCRDVRYHLPRIAERIERLGAMFRDYRVVVYENDSIDRTCEFLFDWRAANRRVTVLSEQLGAPLYPAIRSLDRAAWMARCRNCYREYAVKEFAGYDNAIIVDMDLAGGWSFDGIAHTFAEDAWDFVGSFGLREHRDRRTRRSVYSHADLWAFRPVPGVPTEHLGTHDNAIVELGRSLVPVESCFGGLGIYRFRCLEVASYDGRDCEHVGFHAEMRRAGFGRQFLNPNQIVLYTPVG